MTYSVTLHLPDDLENLLADLRDTHHRTQNAAIGDLVAQIEAQVRDPEPRHEVSS